MVIFDTNAILRYILQDNPKMADEVEQQFLNETCFIPAEVVAETVYVLSKVYGVERNTVAKTLTAISGICNISFDRKNIVLHALRIYASSSFDFVDCLLIGYVKEDNYSLFTFDKKIRIFLKR
jgi:predicted nucleic-acid-binding protein